ncbi:transporter substrate-binding domain-containing protein [Bifidobacterium longum]|uniref:transporter substrate-binding domain-containing protein n=1 Tax=Bifidobacterium longum TaxID=216816 RepID=UPI00353003CB
MFNNQVIRKAAALLSGVAVLVSVAACGSASASNSSALEQVKQAGKIVFATEGTYAPFSYHDSKTNELTGYDVEVAKAIAKEVGIKAEFAEGSFDSLLAGVDAKKYDTVADQISATDERKAKYDFSEPYTYSYGVVITSKENPKNVTSFDDVKGFAPLKPVPPTGTRPLRRRALLSFRLTISVSRSMPSRPVVQMCH